MVPIVYTLVGLPIMKVTSINKFHIRITCTQLIGHPISRQIILETTAD